MVSVDAEQWGQTVGCHDRAWLIPIRNQVMQILHNHVDNIVSHSWMHMRDSAANPTRQGSMGRRRCLAQLVRVGLKAKITHLQQQVLAILIAQQAQTGIGNIRTFCLTRHKEIQEGKNGATVADQQHIATTCG